MSSKKIQSRKASEVIRLKPFTRAVLDSYIVTLPNPDEGHVTHDFAVRALLKECAKEAVEYVKKNRPDLKDPDESGGSEEDT